MYDIKLCPYPRYLYVKSNCGLYSEVATPYVTVHVFVPAETTTVYGLEGESVLLPCNLRETNHNYLHWQFDSGASSPLVISQTRGQPPFLHYGFTKKAQLDFDTGDLQLSGLTLSDECIYMCFYSRASLFLAQKARTVNLTVNGN